MGTRKKILIAPLDWGLGHATRCIPIIEYLISVDVEVVVAASGKVKTLLFEHFPSIEFLFLDGYNVRYAEKNLSFNFLFQTPKIFSKIKEEQVWLQNNIEKHKLDGVISDNRYGLHSKKIPCVIITHQLNIDSPKIFQKKLKTKIKDLVSDFDECWVPDFESDENLSGNLSHDSIIDNVKFIGPLSRFSNLNEVSKAEKFDCIGIISGPESQRTVFENLLFDFFQRSNKKCLLICGKPEEEFRVIKENVTLVSHVKTGEFSGLVTNADQVFCRSGYSSIMDLIALNKGAVLIPTKGQTEQEYLADYLNGKYGFQKLDQKNIMNFEIGNNSIDLLPDFVFNDMRVIQEFVNKISD